MLMLVERGSTTQASTCRLCVSTKYSAHGLDGGAGHAWADDTDLYVWILCFPRRHCLDVGADHVWADDTGLYVWIPWFRASEASALAWSVSRLLSCFTGLLQYATCRCTLTAGVRGAGAIDRSDSFLTLAG